MRHFGSGTILRALILLVMTICAGRGDADEIQWQDDPARAWKSASESGRPMLIFATMEGCVHCRRMEQATFTNASLQSHVNDRFVPVYMELDRHESLMERWRISIFPTTLLVAPNGTVLARIKGFASADELLRQSQDALKTRESVAETASAKTTTSRR